MKGNGKAGRELQETMDCTWGLERSRIDQRSESVKHLVACTLLVEIALRGIEWRLAGVCTLL